MKSSDTLLMVADSDHDANMLYATGMFVPDPFIYLRLRGRATVVMSDLEIDRARRQCPHCREPLAPPLPRVCPVCGGSLQQRYLKLGCITSAPKCLVLGLVWVLARLLRG